MSTVADRPPLDATIAPPGPPPETPASPIVERGIPTEVSAAWELELLIAGAVTFALFQLPGSLESLRASLMAKATGGAIYAVMLAYFYAKCSIYVLIAAFLLNLTTRAYWVGLVGLHSVFPRGVRWDHVRVGPATLEEYRRRHASLPSVIGRVDNFASVIFSFAFVIVVTSVFSLLVSAIFGGVAWGINQLLFGGRHGLAVFEALAFLFAVPLMLVGVIDKKYGARWDPASTAARRLRRAVRFTMRVNGSALIGAIFFTLFTNLRRGVMLTLFYGTFFGSLLVVMVEFFVRLGALSGGAPRYVPDDESVRGVDVAHYESLRAPDPEARAVTIQSDVIEGPYVRLFIPYDAERHDPALATSCSGATPLRPGHLHYAKSGMEHAAAERGADIVLGCLARLHAVTLDGAPQPNLQLRFFTHPTSGRRGMVAYLPTASLAPGMHTLGITPAPRAPDGRATTPARRIEIPFWK